MTNAERIRQMTDEEMANSLSLHSCPPGEDLVELCFDASKTLRELSDEEVYGGAEYESVSTEVCKQCWKNWLQEEATDD